MQDFKAVIVLTWHTKEGNMNKIIYRCGILSLFIHTTDNTKTQKCNEIFRGIIMKEDLKYFFEVLL